MAEFLIHEQQRKPELAAAVVDTSRAAARISEVCQLGVAKASHEAPLPSFAGWEAAGLEHRRAESSACWIFGKGGVHRVGTVVFTVSALGSGVPVFKR